MLSSRRNHILVIFTTVLFLFNGCSINKINNSHSRLDYSSINTNLIKEYLQDSLWSARDAYDAANNLIIPLHYAVQFDDLDLIAEFEKHFSKMLEAYEKDEVELVPLVEMQYLTLASRYLALDSDILNSELKARLALLLESKFEYFWLKSPAIQWNRESFSGGIKERINWKLNLKEKDKSYYNIILDADMFVLGIGADLLTYFKQDKRNCTTCEQVIPVFKKILDDRLNKKVKGWEYQVDYWLDHRDYAYSAYLQKPDENSPPIKVNSIQEDSSHGHRWPMWLLQFSNHIDLEDEKSKLKWQLLNVIISKNQKVGIPILNNFMCGHNGYYRWGYGTHKDTGYGPYKLSGTFAFGWWSLLGGSEISQLYFQLYKAYPMNYAQKTLYSQITTRERHPIIINSYENDLKKQLAIIAYNLSIKF